MKLSIFATFALLLGLLVALPARADEMDLSLSRLRIAAGGTDCPSMTSEGGMRRFCGDEPAWRSIMAQLGGASAPPMLTPARTLGFRGFYLGVEGWISGIDSDADYWRRGTEGDETSGMEGANRFPAGSLFWSRVQLRKGFPFGLELGTSIGHLFGTELFALGADLKLSIFEGFRTGAGALPDVAFRAAVQTIVGDPEFNLTVPSVELLISKPFTVGGAATLTPIVGAQVAFVVADSELVDLTPDASARIDTNDRNNNVVFPSIRATRYRANLGIQGRFQVLTLSAGLVFDIVPPGDADGDIPKDVPRQWTFNAGVGLTY